MHLKCINTCIIKKYIVMALHFNSKHLQNFWHIRLLQDFYNKNANLNLLHFYVIINASSLGTYLLKTTYHLNYIIYFLGLIKQLLLCYLALSCTNLFNFWSVKSKECSQFVRELVFCTTIGHTSPL